MDYKKGTNESLGSFSGINIVPFTDIVLVLLIIFMASAPGLLPSALGIELPEVGYSDKRWESSPDLELALDAKGRILLAGRVITQNKLQERFAGLASEKKDIKLSVYADKNVKHGQVLDLLDLLRSLGIEKIYVGIKEKK